MKRSFRFLICLALCHFSSFCFGDSIALVLPWSQMSTACLQFTNGVPKQQFVDIVAQRLWKNLVKVIEEHNDTFIVCDIEKPGWESVLRTSKKVICFNVPLYAKDWRKIFSSNQKNAFILIQYDPQMCDRNFNKNEIYSRFGKILSCEDGIIDNKKIFKYNYCTLSAAIENPIAFPEKKMFTQISSNIYYSWPGELYTERKAVINYFEKHPSESFEFYGRFWPSGRFSNYKGGTIDKIATLKNYKFAFCYENNKKIHGYISEKIFDCFIANCIPIYLGAPNIESYIPAECYVDRRKFDSMDTLIDYLKHMSPIEYQEKIAAINTFLRSEKASIFSDEAFQKSLSSVLYEK